MGVGPGDPSLLTLAAVEAIRRAQVVAYPVGRPGADSIAARIAASWIRNDHQRLPLLFPMVDAAEPRRAAWGSAAQQLQNAIRSGQQVALLCEGDASLFASCSYVLLAIRQEWPDCPITVIPGITSCSAAAAAGLWPLALQQDQLLVRPCPDTSEELELVLNTAATTGQVLALLKLGRRWSWVQPLLKQRSLLKQALFAEQVGWPEQRICPADAVKAEPRPYFSLLLIRQGWPDVLP